MVLRKRSVRRVVLIDGRRTPFQRSGTAFRDLTSYDLARLALSGLLKATQVDPEKVDRVILGTVVSNFTTSNVAREAALAAGLPNSTPAHTVTQACISSNQAITSGADLIRTGQADVVIAGGTESLSDIPIRYRKPFRRKLVEAQKYRSFLDYFKFLQGLHLADLLPEVPSISEFSTGRTMGEDCERLASRYGVTRPEQDAFAVRSHQLAAKAAREGLFDREIEPVWISPDFEAINADNGIRADTTLEKLARLKPVFVKPYGELTAGNSSFLTDGAAAVLLMSEETAGSMGYAPKAVIKDYAYSAQDPELELLLGPACVIPKVLDRTGLGISDIDVFEFHEAFAGQVVANLKCLASTEFARQRLNRSEEVGEVPMDKLNTMGGSLAIGHPFGATGARLITTAANRLLRQEGQFALLAACAAGGMGNAILLERYAG